jgi:hypothetical protein
MMSVGVMNKIRQFGAGTAYHAQTTVLGDGVIDRLFERNVFENAYFPNFTGTTGAANIAVVGDFSNYRVNRNVRRARPPTCSTPGITVRREHAGSSRTHGSVAASATSPASRF